MQSRGGSPALPDQRRFPQNSGSERSSFLGAQQDCNYLTPQIDAAFLKA